MSFSAQQIASIVSGVLEGNPETTVTGFGKIEEAGPSDLAFLSNPKYEAFLYRTDAGIVLVNSALELKKEVKATLIRVPDAYSAFARLLEAYQQIQQDQLTGIEEPGYRHPTASYGNKVYLGAFSYLGKNVRLGNNVKIYPHTYIGDNSIIGDDTIIYAGVKIYDRTQIGKRVIIHAGTVLGSDGFGFAPTEGKAYQKIPQTGNVVVEDDVEIGANTCIDRATIGSTIIRQGSKLDNLVQVAHNVEVGSHTVLAGQSGVSGSTKLGSHVMVGGQAGIAGHLRIGDHARINGQAGVNKDLAEKAAVTGTPASDYVPTIKAQALLRKLPEIVRRMDELEKKLGE